MCKNTGLRNNDIGCFNINDKRSDLGNAQLMHPYVANDQSIHFVLINFVLSTSTVASCVKCTALEKERPLSTFCVSIFRFVGLEKLTPNSRWNEAELILRTYVF